MHAIIGLQMAFFFSLLFRAPPGAPKLAPMGSKVCFWSPKLPQSTPHYGALGERSSRTEKCVWTAQACTDCIGGAPAEHPKSHQSLENARFSQKAQRMVPTSPKSCKYHPKWCPFGTLWASPFPPQTDPNAQKVHSGDPNGSTAVLEATPGTKSAPNAPQSLPNVFQMLPKVSQKSPKIVPKGSHLEVHV